MTDDDLQTHLQQLHDDGVTVLPPQLTAAECDEARAVLDSLYGERERGGFELLFNKAPVFESLFRKPAVLRLIRHVLGDDALISGMYGSILEPGQGGGALHADGAITGHNRRASLAAGDGGRRVTSHVLGLNTIWAISEFTADNGATEIVRRSHRHESLDKPEGAEDAAMPMVAPRGSVVVFNVNTWHGPSSNRTTTRRYAVLNPWRRHWMRCEYEMAAVVDPGVLERAGEEARIFGLDAREPTTERWRWDRDAGRPLAT
jgi:ectoine hydroxylase-related dioxygenase (phytanoyl-CoA dioxygenase family)